MHRLSGVLDNILDNLPYLSLVSVRVPEVVVGSQCVIGKRPAQREPCGIFDQRLKRDCLSDRLSAFGESEQLACKIDRHCEGLFSLLKHFGCLFPVVDIHFGHCHVPEYPLQKVVEVMGYTAGQDADGFEFLGTQKLFFHFLFFGDIAFYAQQGDNLAVFITQWNSVGLQP